MDNMMMSCLEHCEPSMKAMDAGATTIAGTPHVVDHRALGESRASLNRRFFMEAV
jgi:hypothetical protein